MLIDTFIKEKYSKSPKKIYDANKTVVKHLDDTWSRFIR